MKVYLSRFFRNGFRRYFLLQAIMAFASAAILLAINAQAASARSGLSPDAFFAQFNRPDFHIITNNLCDVKETDGDLSLSPSILLQENLSQDLSLLPRGAGLGSSSLSSQINMELRAQSILDGSGKMFGTNWFSWVPTARPSRESRPECSAQTLQNEILNAGSTPYSRIQLMSTFFKRCGDHLTRNDVAEWRAMLNLDEVEYNFCQNDSIRRVKIRLPDGVILDGWLAMKLDEKPRPMIIARCGIFCNPGTTSERLMMMNLFDETSANLLLINNISGSQFSYDNHFFGMGGVEEGYQMIEVAQMVDSSTSPLRPYIESMDVAGLSLGAHAALYAGYYNNFYRTDDGRQLFKSVIVLSPVVDLQPTFVNTLTNGLWGNVLSRVAWNSLSVDRRYDADLQRLIPNNKRPEPSKFPGIMAAASVAGTKKLRADWPPSVFAGQNFSSINSYWKMNDFLAVAHQIQIPTFIWASNDDWVVDPQVNSLALVRENEANQPHSNIEVLDTPLGNHCGFSQFYGWNIASAVIRASLATSDPAMNQPAQQIQLAMTLPGALRLRSGETYFSRTWHARAGEAGLTASFRIYRPKNGDDCRDPYTDDGDCFRKADLQVSFQQLGLGEWRIPRTTTDAQALTRWANTHIFIEGLNGQPLQGNTSQPLKFIVERD